MISQSSLTVDEMETSVAAVRTRPRVWMVDDSDDFRSLLAQLLTSEGGLDCERQFSSPEAVLAALAEDAAPDVILLDIQMGEACGLDAIQPIKSLAGSTHVIMLTTCFDSQYQQRARKSGATDFLLKSYSLEQIAQRVWRAMELPVPGAPPIAEVSVRQPEPCVTNSANGHFRKTNLHHRLAVWRNASNRFLRGAFYVRSLLTLW